MSQRIGKSLMRFPVAFGMLFLLVAVLLFHAFCPKTLSETVYAFAWQFPAIGFLIALAIGLMREHGVFGSRGWVTEGLALAAWLGLAVWYARRPGIGVTYGMSAVAVAVVIAGLVVPFWQDRDDGRMCLGIRDILHAGFVSAFVTVLILACVMFLYESGVSIFHTEVDESLVIEEVLAILFGLGLFGVLFLAWIPAPWPSGKGLLMEGAAKWLFLPLLGAYLLTLYFYALRILVQWKLPDGEVATLVTVSMVLLVSVLYVLGPWARKGVSDKVGIILQALPWLMIPLLVLMSVGTVRRISDYGMTVDRVYLVLFNLWCYGVCLYLGITGCRKFRWIPVSFALILLLASVGPWNVSRMVRKGMEKEVRILVGDAVLPLTGGSVKELGEDTMRSLWYKLDYLKKNYGAAAIEAYADSTAVEVLEDMERGRNLYRHGELHFEAADVNSSLGLYWTIDVPQGFDHCMYVFQHYPNKHSMEVLSVSDETIRFSLESADKTYQFDLPCGDLKEPVLLQAVDAPAVFLIKEIRIQAKVLDDVETNGPKADNKKGIVTGLLFY